VIRTAGPGREHGYASVRVGPGDQDIEALIDEADGSAYPYGISSGACPVHLAAAKLGPARGEKLALHEPPYGPGGDRGGHEFAEQRKQLGALIGRGRRSDAVTFFIAGTGAPPEAIEEMRGSPDWQAMEGVEGTLAYDCAVRGDGSVPLDVAGTPTISTLVLDGSESFEFSTVWPTLQPEVFRAPFGRHIEHQMHDVSPDAPAPVVKEYFGSAVQGEADYGLLHHFLHRASPVSSRDRRPGSVG